MIGEKEKEKKKEMCMCEKLIFFFFSIYSQFLALLIQLTNSKKVIEVGTFLGYTTLAIAQALPSDGKIVTLDISDDFTKKAKPYWEVSSRVYTNKPTQ